MIATKPIISIRLKPEAECRREAAFGFLFVFFNGCRSAVRGCPVNLIGLFARHLNRMAGVKRLPDVPLSGVMMIQAATREGIMQRAAKLPAAALVLPQLQSLLQDRNASLEQVCDLLKMDMSLTARILQLSNSPYFAPGIPIASLEEAVGFVGYDEIYRVAGLVVGMQLAQKDLRLYGCPSSRLWENTLCGAFAMESLAQFAGVSPRLAYTAGMMRSMGKVVLDMLRPDAAPAQSRFNPHLNLSLGEWELETFGCDSPAAGALLLEEWNFPQEIFEAVLLQTNPGSPELHAAYASLLNLAAGMAEDLGYPLPGEQPYWMGKEARMDTLRLTGADMALCQAETQLSFDSLKEAFASGWGAGHDRHQAVR